MKIVVDTNIVFSAILNSSRDIGKVLILYGRFFEFYSCDFLREELILHHKKLIKLTKLSEKELGLRKNGFVKFGNAQILLNRLK